MNELQRTQLAILAREIRDAAHELAKLLAPKAGRLNISEINELLDDINERHFQICDHLMAESAET